MIYGSCLKNTDYSSLENEYEKNYKRKAKEFRINFNVHMIQN